MSRVILPSGPVIPVQTSRIGKQKACVQCRTRKVKCDKNSPCANCSAWVVDCIYPAPIRSCKRPRREPNSSLVAEKSTSLQSMNEKIHHLEKTIRQLKTYLESHHIAPLNKDLYDQVLDLTANCAKDSPTGQLEASEASDGESATGTALIGIESQPFYTTELGSHTAFASSGFQPTVEFPGIASGMWWAEPRPPFRSLPLEPAVSYFSLQRAQVCWPTFLRNIDPLIKVLHRQTTENIIRKATHHESFLSKGEQGLLCAICFSCISSMTDEDAEICFELPKDAALEAYRSATEKFLMEANFLITDDLVTLQTLVLFLSFGRFINEGKLAWALTGVAARLNCQSGGDMSQFEKEIRRRLWWHLWYLDRRATEDHGRAANPPFSNVDTEMPLNIKDLELEPNMVMLPNSQHGWTEISFSLILFEIAYAGSKMEGNLPLRQKEEMIEECEYKIQTTYLRYCQEGEPIHWLAKHVSHVLITEKWLKLYGGLPISSTMSPRIQAKRDSLFLTAVDIVDMLRNQDLEPEAQRWKWLLNAYLHYIPLAFILTELCHRRDSQLVDRAWRVVERAILRWGGQMKNSKHEKALALLMAKVIDQRSKTEMPWSQQWRLNSHDQFQLPNGLGEPMNTIKEPHSQTPARFTLFPVDEPQLEFMDLLPSARDIALLGSVDSVTEITPDSYDTSDWNNLAPFFSAIDGSFEETVLGQMESLG